MTTSKITKAAPAVKAAAKIAPVKKPATAVKPVEKKEEAKPAVVVNAPQKLAATKGRTFTPEEKKAQLNRPLLPTLAAHQRYDGLSGYLTKKDTKTAIDFSLFRTNTNIRLTERDLNFMADIRDFFGAEYFTRAGVVNGMRYGLDAGTLRHAITGGYVNVRPGFETREMATAPTCQFYITAKGLRTNYGSLFGAWHGDDGKSGKRASWDGKSAAFRAGDIDKDDEAKESK